MRDAQTYAFDALQHYSRLRALRVQLHVRALDAAAVGRAFDALAATLNELSIRCPSSNDDDDDDDNEAEGANRVDARSTEK